MFIKINDKLFLLLLLKMGIFKSEKYNHFKTYAITAFSLMAIFYIIDTIQMNTKNNIRNLAESDSRSTGPNEICMEIDGNTKFDLFGLKKVNPEIDEKIELKFCQNVEKHSSSCIYKREGDTGPIKLAETINGQKNNKNKVKVINSKTESERKVIMYLAAGDRFLNDNQKRYEIEIHLYCLKNETFQIKQEETSFEPEKYHNLTLSAYTKYACGENDAYLELDKAERIIAGIVFAIGGLMTGILGYNQVKIGIFLVCTMGGLLLAGVIIIFFSITKLAIIIVILVLFLIAGIGLFIFFIKKNEYLKFYMLLIGGLCGYPIAQTVYKVCFAIIDTEYQKLIQIIIIVVFIIIGVIIGFIVPKYTCIVGTSIIGAFAVMRALSFFLYGKVDYIDEEKLYDFARTGNYEKVADMIVSTFLIYPAILIVLIIVFIIVQIKINPNWKDVDDYKDLNNKFIEKPSDLPDFKLSDYGETEEEEKKEEVKKEEEKKEEENKQEV